jgi:hypothetical protein
MCQTHRSNPDEPFEGTEDSWCSSHTTDYPDAEFRIRHIMESIHVDDPYIIHQFWTFTHCYLFLNREQFAELWSMVLHIG